MSYSQPLEHLVVSVSVGRTFGDRPAARLEVGRWAVEVFALRPRRRWQRLTGPGHDTVSFYGPFAGVSIEKP